MTDLPQHEPPALHQLQLEFPTPRIKWMPDPDRSGSYILMQMWEMRQGGQMWTEWRPIPLEEKQR